MAAKKKSNLGPKVRALLEQALLEALKRHYGKSKSAKKKTPARKKKAGKKKVSKKKSVSRRKRRA